MIIFDIPLDGSATGIWLFEVDGLRYEFDTRGQLLAFVAARAKEMSRSGTDVLLNIEGADGIWRLFGADLRAAW